MRERVSDSCKGPVSAKLSERRKHRLSATKGIPTAKVKRAPMENPHPTNQQKFLGHMVPHSTPSRTAQQRKRPTRIAKSTYKNAVTRRSLSRPSIHKYLPTLFTNGQDPSVHQHSPRPRSSVPWLDSKMDSSAYGSLPGIDVVSPETFTLLTFLVTYSSQRVV